jgi:hypothetical protein
VTDEAVRVVLAPEVAPVNEVVVVVIAVPCTIFALEDHVVPFVLKGILPVAVGAAATTATPPTVVAPVTAKVLLKVVAPVTAKVLLKVVAPVVPRVPVTVAVPATVKLFPTATFPLASLTMLVVELDGCMTFMVLRVDN